MFLNKAISLYESVKFFANKQDTKVLFFKVPSTVLLSQLNVDAVQYVSDSIDNVLSIKHPDNKILSKIQWLIDSIQKEKIYNPIQLINDGDRYFVHPGSTKLIVSTYLLGNDIVDGFYIWDKNIDPSPFILDYVCEEIKNPVAFIKKFNIGKRFCILSQKLSNNTVIRDVDKDDGLISLYLTKSNGAFRTALSCLKNNKREFNTLFITYIDKIQWDKKIDLEYRSIDDKFYFRNLVFKKIKNQWVLIR